MNLEDINETVLRKANLLVRYVLGAEGKRTPIKREELSKVVLPDNNRNFNLIFERAQLILKDTFGLQLKELPIKEVVGSKSKTKPAKTYVVISVLDNNIRGESYLPFSKSNETSLVGLTLSILSILFINNHKINHAFLVEIYRKFKITDPKVMKEFTNTLIKQNYLQRISTTKRSQVVSSSSKVADQEFLKEEHDYVWGPRAKVEVSFDNLSSFIKEVYGDNVPSNLDYHLQRFSNDRPTQ